MSQSPNPEVEYIAKTLREVLDSSPESSVRSLAYVLLDSLDEQADLSPGQELLLAKTLDKMFERTPSVNSTQGQDGSPNAASYLMAGVLEASNGRSHGARHAFSRAMAMGSVGILELYRAFEPYLGRQSAQPRSPTQNLRDLI